MDHLELPRQSKHPPITVPYLCSDVFDDHAFKTYFERKGWTEDDVEGGESCTKSLDERAAFLQCWLFFGLLRTVFESHYAEDDWIDRHIPEESVVTLRELEQRLSRLFTRTSYLSQAGLELRLFNVSDETEDTERSARRNAVLDGDCEASSRTSGPAFMSRLADILSYTLDWNTRIMNQGLQHHPLDVVCLSIAALGEFLGAFIQNIDEDKWLRYSSCNYLFNRMLDDGWCPIEIIRLRNLADLDQIYYLSNLDRPGSMRDHQECRKRMPLEALDDLNSFGTGSESETWNCTAYQLDWKTYKTHHVTGCTKCETLVACASTMHDILKNGHCPLLRSTFKGDEESDIVTGKTTSTKRTSGALDLVSTKHYKRYVCISHVWSDGLGNPHQNAIPRCQYERLSRLVDELCPGEDVPFWLDTISVPREPVDLRRDAIMSMHKTYWDADAVLVLDQYLLGVDIDDVTEKEIQLRVLACNWMRRLWTLQESVLAKRVVFQLKNGAIDLDRSRFFNLDSSDTSINQWVTLRGAWKRAGENIANQTQRMFGTLSSALAWRTTSIKEDEAICLSIITGMDPIDVGRIAAIDSHEDRMIKFWQSTKGLSSNILFWGGPRIPRAGLRWAPLSFLNKGLARSMQSGPNPYLPALVGDEGLRVKLPGLSIGRWRQLFHGHVYLRVRSDLWYRVSSDMDVRPPPSTSDKIYLGLLFQNSDLSSIENLSRHDVSAALIVAMRSPLTGEAECISVEPLCLASVEKADRFEGWVEPLEKLHARFYEKCEKHLAIGTGMLRVNGTTLGHFNDDTEVDSDIDAFWNDGRLSFDLGSQHLMFEVDVILQDQEWCCG